MPFTYQLTPRREGLAIVMKDLLLWAEHVAVLDNKCRQ